MIENKKKQTENTKIYNESIKIIRGMSAEEFKAFIKIIKIQDTDKKVISKIEKYYASKNLITRVSSIKSPVSIVEEVYYETINKIEKIIANKDILKKIDGLKVLLYGETGTGKTSLVKAIAERNSNINFLELNLEEIISSKMGQTQINLFAKLNEINDLNKTSIIFIDELDSVVGNRKKEDVGERKKIASTFLKFIDALNSNIIFIASTNYIEDIDDSIIRRFNFKQQGVNIDVENTIKFIDKELRSTLIRKKTSLVSSVSGTFTISDINNFINKINIERAISQNVDIFLEFMIMFRDKFISLSEFDKKRAERIENGNT